MALERRNPLPPGRYWLQLPEADEPSFGVWRSKNKATVFTEKTTYHQVDGWTWYLFRVSAPVAWNAAAWGFPNTADASVRSEADVLSLPAPQPGFIESFESASRGFSTGLLLVAGLLGVVILGRVFR